jgi:hypothetical protein
MSITSAFSRVAIPVGLAPISRELGSVRLPRAIGVTGEEARAVLLVAARTEELLSLARAGSDSLPIQHFYGFRAARAVVAEHKNVIRIARSGSCRDANDLASERKDVLDRHKDLLRAYGGAAALEYGFPA